MRARVSRIDQVDGEIILIYEDTQTGEYKRTKHDMAVLSVGLEPDQNANVLGNLLGLSRRPDGFFEIAHPKMRPVEAHIDGVFIAGCASGPKEIPISIAQGSAAAAKAIKLLHKGVLELEPTSAYVDPDLCVKCKLCVDVCSKKAIAVKSPAYVDEAACKGCGSCAAACPVDAINMRFFSDEQIVSPDQGGDRSEERVSPYRGLSMQLVQLRSGGLGRNFSHPVPDQCPQHSRDVFGAR